MEIQPIEVFKWCLDENDPNGDLLKKPPPEEIIQTGLLVGQPFARLWHNYAFNNIGGFLAFIEDTVLGIGSIVTEVNNVNPNTLGYRGTWVEAGEVVTTGTGARTIYNWERTA